MTRRMGLNIAVIREAMKRRGYRTARALARDLGISDATMSRILAGRILPRLGRTVRLCNLLDVRITDVIDARKRKRR